MPNVKVSIPYQIPQDEALSRLKAAIVAAKAQYSDKISDLHENWNAYAGTFSGSGSGISVSGKLIVNPSVVDVEVTLPAVAMFFKGKIESMIRNQLTQMLS